MNVLGPYTSFSTLKDPSGQAVRGGQDLACVVRQQARHPTRGLLAQEDSCSIHPAG
jgi:hypothetical protein